MGLQVLGGAGPAIAAVPLTVVWAGTSALSLLNNIRTRQVGPVGAVQRVGFVLFTGVGQIVSAFSRMGAASMTYLPPNRSGHLTDRSLLTRAVQRPANAPDAFRSAFEEFITGVFAGAAGTLLDPVQASHIHSLSHHPLYPSFHLTTSCLVKRSQLCSRQTQAAFLLLPDWTVDFLALLWCCRVITQVA